MTYAALAGGAFALALLAAGAAAHEGHKPPQGAGAAGSYAFPIPTPGSYGLPPIKPAGGGPILDERGRRHDLADFLRGRTTVLAFIYTRCGDVCPAATLQMSLLQDLATKRGDVSERMRLVTMSFDPDHDTPAVMGEHAAHWRSQARGAPEWLFLTAPDRESLAPVLSAYNQGFADRPAPAHLPGLPGRRARPHPQHLQPRLFRSEAGAERRRDAAARRARPAGAKSRAPIGEGAEPRAPLALHSGENKARTNERP
jgi:protein SCO1